VNNDRKPEGVPTVNSDWWNYGGITRDVMLVETPNVFVDDYLVQLPKGSYDRVEGYVQLNEKMAGVEVSLEIPELKLQKKLITDASGKATFTCKPNQSSGRPILLNYMMW